MQVPAEAHGIRRRRGRRLPDEHRDTKVVTEDGRPLLHRPRTNLHRGSHRSTQRISRQAQQDPSQIAPGEKGATHLILSDWPGPEEPAPRSSWSRYLTQSTAHNNSSYHSGLVYVVKARGPIVPCKTP